MIYMEYIWGLLNLPFFSNTDKNDNIKDSCAILIQSIWKMHTEYKKYQDYKLEKILNSSNKSKRKNRYRKNKKKYNK